MRIATYNMLKGGSQRVHWVRMIEDFGVDLLLVQESYPHHEHLPPLMYPDAGKQSAWEMAEKNGWGSGHCEPVLHQTSHRHLRLRQEFQDNIVDVVDDGNMIPLAWREKTCLSGEIEQRGEFRLNLLPQYLEGCQGFRHGFAIC